MRTTVLILALTLTFMAVSFVAPAADAIPCVRDVGCINYPPPTCVPGRMCCPYDAPCYPPPN